MTVTGAPVPRHDTVRFDVAALGEAMVEFNQVARGEYRQGFGGDTSNVAIAAARQGARAAYCTRIGDDPFGAMLLALWEAEGVDASGVAVDAGANTGIYFVDHDAAGHRFHYLRAGSAASRMRPADLPRDVIAGSRWLHVSGISQAISASACESVFEAIAIAREAGARVSYDPNLRLRLWSLERARPVIERTMALADLFLPSLDEAEALAGAAGVEAVFDWCARRGARQVVLKCGADGAWFRERPDCAPVHLAGVRANTVDATGAGDCFDGSLLARLAAGDGIGQAVRYANRAAALSTTGFGAVAPIPHAATLAALREQGENPL